MKKTTLYCLLLLLSGLSACKKYLDEKPDKKLQVPSTLQDLWSLLDRNEIMNRSAPWLGEASADDYYLLPADFDRLSAHQRNLYTWQSPSIQDATPNNWSDVYKVIYYANVVLDELPKIKTTDQTDYNALRGSALLFRAKAFLDALWIWAGAYDATNADRALGIPLRLSSSVNEPTVRASVKEGYEQVLKDLTEAADLLPEIADHPMRASKAAAFGLLARTALSMREYEMAGTYADRALQLTDKLLDFEDLDIGANYPIERFNEEVVMHFRCSASFSSSMKVDTSLYSLYEDGDLRKDIYFRKNSDNSHSFKGSYDNTFYLFSGVTTSELLLTRAECYARTGRPEEALNDVNNLRRMRFRKSQYQPLVNDEDLLVNILTERRKDLLMRGLRFIDIKRLNREGQNIILKRVVKGEEYLLEPNSGRYALSIPQIIVDITGIPQN